MSYSPVGLKRMKEILGEKVTERALSDFEKVSPEFAEYVTGFAYGDIYSRPKMADRDRELAAVACLIGQRNTGPALKSHLIGMMNVGWQAPDICELLLFLIPYCGFPDIVGAFTALREIQGTA